MNKTDRRLTFWPFFVIMNEKAETERIAEMTKQQKRARMSEIVNKLKEVYPEAVCALEWNGEPWKLLIMGRLSAQCTDARVNTVCRDLFATYPTPQSLADAEVSDIERYIRSCGLYHVIAHLGYLLQCRLKIPGSQISDAVKL